MCNTYLGRKAYAYFGSTTIAYGPGTTNDQADLICQYFLEELLDGASAGRSCLEARLKYVRTKSGVLTPTDLKTLAQFNLMADPSVTPVVTKPRAAVIASAAGAHKIEAAAAPVFRNARLRTRAVLKARAEATAAYRLRKPRSGQAAVKSARLARVMQLASENGIKRPDLVLSYEVGPVSGVVALAKALASHTALRELAPRAIHVILQRQEPPEHLPHLILIRGLQAVEYENELVAQVFQSR